jgi:ribosomal protein L11 methyltransferase
MSQTTPQTFWVETIWHMPKSEVEIFMPQLEVLGSLGSYEKMELMAEDEDLRTESDLVAYFPDTNDLESLQKKLRTLENDLVTLNGTVRIPQAEWATEWKKYFKPFALTDEIVIRPSWEEYTAKPNEKVVVLDPGMAFGTGQHDTTRFCSEFICEIKRKDPNLKTLIDVGCGSGILSIIAKKVGFETVVGFDIDGPTIETANENLERNPDAAPLLFYHSDGSLKSPELTPSDVVVSNIIAETLAELKDDLVALVKPQGLLILSGILPQREELVKTAFDDLELLEEKKSKDWHAYLYRRK